MAMPLQLPSVGVDVSLSELVICRGPEQRLERLANEASAIATWLRALEGPVQFAVEATGTYHREFLAQAHAAGHRVFVIDGYRLRHYRDGVGGRAKTDASDARLLARYLEREHDQLRPWSPPPRAYASIQALLRRRSVLVRTRVSLEQSLGALPELRGELARLRETIQRLERALLARITKALGEAGWQAAAQRCQAIEGIGPLSAAALTTAFHRGRFRSSDAFIAFLGLDVRVRDSGKKRGQRKLTKKGDPELRRLLYLAAMQAKRSEPWASYYQRHIHRGLAPTQALVSLARKLARVAFALLSSGQSYNRDRLPQACPQT